MWLQVIVRPKLEGFNETVDFDAEELRKFFKVRVVKLTKDCIRILWR